MTTDRSRDQNQVPGNDAVLDARRDPDSTAHVHLEKSVDGPTLTNSRPPQSVADAQTKIKGWSPVKFFDKDNDAKRVQGVSHPSGNVLLTDQEQAKALNTLRFGGIGETPSPTKGISRVKLRDDFADQMRQPQKPDGHQPPERSRDDGQER